ncbi:protein-disulfide reductase DsbD domain-containing protein [Salipiger mucosus]|uniref:Thio:disulfide interchange protein, putative n=1 Tax=Salipiger mucosus DSM 16094 TaxID=1123237 RepID=S9RRG0_9RHOB|nr:protein-disulfide reductase DsbD domain-containing protein [Salipiger mucosus]EPX76549.1 thio:disulfide interchange protein, putative [Salipiger mucosus DSM 16094]
MIRRLLASMACAAALALPAAAQEPVTAELRPGWRLPDGDHVAALHLRLAPGWKTYWRAPGAAGIPPEFDWSGSRNTGRITALWPTPHVFRQSGMRSIGYKQELVLPLRIETRGSGDAKLSIEMDLGICSDVCLPHSLSLTGRLPADVTQPDPAIAAALASSPFSASEAGVRGVRCSIRPVKGGIALHAEIDMPTAGGQEEAVVESGQPMLWASEPRSARKNGTLVTETKLMHVEGGAFALDRSRLRFTVIGKDHAVDIRGCDP